MKAELKSRFDTRLTKAQKELFEQAANLIGARSLSEFIINSAQERAKKIIEDHGKILVTQEDREIFFNEIVNPSPPNEALRRAAAEYNAMVRKK